MPRLEPLLAASSPAAPPSKPMLSSSSRSSSLLSWSGSASHHLSPRSSPPLWLPSSPPPQATCRNPGSGETRMVAEDGIWGGGVCGGACGAAPSSLSRLVTPAVPDVRCSTPAPPSTSTAPSGLVSAP
eukprot:1490336-Rhodomonas_salina.1